MNYFQKIISNTFGESGDIGIQPLVPSPSKLPLQNISDYGDPNLEENGVPEDQNLSSLVFGSPQIKEGNDSKVVATEKNMHKPDIEEANIVGDDHNDDNKNPTIKASGQNILESSQKKETEKKFDSKTKKTSKNPDIFQETDRYKKTTSEESSDPVNTLEKPVQFSSNISKGKHIITDQKKDNDQHSNENLQEGSTKKPLKTKYTLQETPKENITDPTITSISPEKALTQVFTYTPQNLENSTEITPRQISKESIPDKSLLRTHVTIGNINIEVVAPSQAENKKVIEKEIIYKSSGPPAKSTFNNNTGLNVRFGLGQL